MEFVFYDFRDQLQAISSNKVHNSQFQWIQKDYSGTINMIFKSLHRFLLPPNDK